MYCEPIWKGGKRKKHRARNNPKPTDQDCCIICGKPYAELHEIYFGKNRQNSIKYNMQARLCEEHHRGKRGVHNDIQFDLQLKREYQHKFEAKYSREVFVRIFGKNYLEGEVA